MFDFFHKEIRQDIRAKTAVSKRPKHFILYIDLAKAFDSINRTKLIECMYRKKVNTTLVNAIRMIYSNTKMQTSTRQTAATTSRGVMQGAVLSPKLFAIYIDDMLTALNRYGIGTWALADDLVITTRGEYHLQLAISTLKEYCSKLDLSINHRKSGLMCVRVDNR